jgi:hypothetical protein
VLLAKGRYLEGGFNAPVAIQVLGGDGRLLVRMPPAPALVTTTGTWPAGTWQHIALSWDGARYRLYVNGSEEAGLDNAFSIFDSTDPITLGNADGFAAGGFAGLLDEPTLYNRALTPAEVTALHAARGLGKCTATYSRADAGPDQAVEVAATVTLDGSASRAFDGAPLSYQWTLASRPANSAAVLSQPERTVSPSFVADQAGAYTLELIVSNAGRASAPDSVSITAAKVNHAPTITSTAITAAAVGTAYTYPVTASDPDVRRYAELLAAHRPRRHEHQCRQRPDPVDPQRWADRQPPRHRPRPGPGRPVRPADLPARRRRRAGTGHRPRTSSARSRRPRRSALTAASLSVGTVTLAASDTVAAGRVISQNPAAGTRGQQRQRRRPRRLQRPARSGRRLDPRHPDRTADPHRPDPGLRRYRHPRQRFQPAADQRPHLDEQQPGGRQHRRGRPVVSALSEGSTTISASQGGVTGSTVFGVAQSVPESTLPIAQITAPADGASIASAVPIVGTASDANFLKYLIEIAPFETGVFSTLHVGTAPVTNGTLATLDPTTLVNDLYVVRLTVIDRADNRTQTEITVQLTRDKKVGNFTLAFQDLNVPMAGIPISVVRSYDSRDKTRGDFGIGWRLDVQSLRLRVVGRQGEGWQINAYGRRAQPPLHDLADTRCTRSPSRCPTARSKSSTLTPVSRAPSSSRRSWSPSAVYSPKAQTAAACAHSAKRG